MKDNTMHTYRVIVKPIDRYFFGSEKTFIPADGSRANYLVRSRKYPQQTTLLGMMRYAFLKNLMDSEVIAGKSDVKSRIGETGFRNDSGAAYGIIDSLSALFLVYSQGNQWKNCYLLGLDHQKHQHTNEETGEVTLEDKDFVYKEKKEGGKSLLVGKHNYLPTLERFNHKQYMVHNWWNESTNKRIRDDELIIPFEQPGNQKSYAGETLEDAFYKQTFYYLAPRYAFAFYLHTNTPLDTENMHPFKVFMGADQSEFYVTITSGTNHFSNLSQSDPLQSDIVKVILLSDGYITQKALEQCRFSINNMVDFRYIQTTISMENHAAMDFKPSNYKEPVNPRKSNKSFLAEKGSVFYLDRNHLQTFTKNLKDQTAFRKIGYNHYKTEPL